jgi:hypothetical protein
VWNVSFFRNASKGERVRVKELCQCAQLLERIVLPGWLVSFMRTGFLKGVIKNAAYQSRDWPSKPEFSVFLKKEVTNPGAERDRDRS